MIDWRMNVKEFERFYSLVREKNIESFEHLEWEFGNLSGNFSEELFKKFKRMTYGFSGDLKKTFMKQFEIS